MSGNRLADGIEAVVVEISGGIGLKARLVAHIEAGRSDVIFAEAYFGRVFAWDGGGDFAELNFLLSGERHFARAALAVIQDCGTGAGTDFCHRVAWADGASFAAAGAVCVHAADWRASE